MDCPLIFFDKTKKFEYLLAQIMLGPFRVNLDPAESRYTLPLQTVLLQISTLLDLHYLSLTKWICINNMDLAVRLVDN